MLRAIDCWFLRIDRHVQRSVRDEITAISIAASATVFRRCAVAAFGGGVGRTRTVGRRRVVVAADAAVIVR